MVITELWVKDFIPKDELIESDYQGMGLTTKKKKITRSILTTINSDVNRDWLEQIIEMAMQDYFCENLGQPRQSGYYFANMEYEPTALHIGKDKYSLKKVG